MLQLPDKLPATSDLYARNIEVTEVIGTGLVELIEEDQIQSTQMEELLTSYLQPLIEKDIDYLVLGCSHYPYLIPTIEKILPKDVRIFDSGEAVARQTKAILSSQNLLNLSDETAYHKFYSNHHIKTLQNILASVAVPYTVEYLDF